MYTRSQPEINFANPRHLNARMMASTPDVDSELVSLLEENARLRSLVVQLSDLVLKNVLEQK